MKTILRATTADATCGLGEQIRQRRRQRELSQGVVARRLAYSPAAISLLERGKRNLLVTTLVQVADAMDCDVEVRLVPRQPRV